MAERRFFEVQALNREVKVIAGTFFPNGTSAVDNASNIGSGWTVARTNVGDFTITLADAYQQLLHADFQVHLAADADTDIVGKAHDVSASSKTVTLTVNTAGSPADIAADPDNKISFMLLLSRTSSP